MSGDTSCLTCGPGYHYGDEGCRHTPSAGSDRLAVMLTLQSELQTVMPPHRAFPSDDRVVLMQQIRDNALSLVAETIEAIDETGWKPWASSNHINHKALHSEIVDMWHFFMNLMILADMTADELWEGYRAKHQKNRARQLNGYDGVSTKCPQCKRAYDDSAVLCEPAVISRSDEDDERADGWCERTGKYL